MTDIVATPDLDRLAAAVGLLSDYEDAWGKRQEVPEETKRRLLAAMGFPINDPAALAAALRDLEEAPWRRLLPPFLILRDGNAVRPVPLAVPLEAGALLRWRLEQEDGSVREGECRTGELAVAATRHVDGSEIAMCHLILPLDLPDGYHRLRVSGPAGEAECVLVGAPATCHLPEAMRAGRVWGLVTQLYALRDARDWGMGDFGTLARLIDGAAALGASVIGVNPLHALFPAEPAKASPYSPSGRAFLEVLYLDIAALPEFAQCPEAQERLASSAFQSRIEALRAEDLVDRPGVAAAKFEILDLLYRAFRARHLDDASGPSARGAAFRSFQEAGGRDLERFARFEALAEYFRGDRPWMVAWMEWPAAYRDPDSEAVAVFAAANRARVEFFQYLQWNAAEQLAALWRRAHEAGMPVGLYGDLALGVDAAGAEAWSQQDIYVQGVSLGAPPDVLGPKGQNWGLPPLNPITLKAHAYRPFLRVLRANMRSFGALRIDHVMSLMRLFWIPAGMTADQGGYVRYPFDDLLALVRLESRRNKCLVIGEDLGTVPDELRRRLQAAHVLSYRLLYFERDEDGAFQPPEHYPDLALVAVSTHDLPTLAGFWRGEDLRERITHNAFPDADTAERAQAERAAERRNLVAALAARDLLPPDFPASGALTPEQSDALFHAAHLYLAATPGRLLMVQAEDVLGLPTQPNLPGTGDDERLNWRHRLPETVEDMLGTARMRALAAAISERHAPKDQHHG
jgi:4-alpha-glucanotransferase